MDERTSEPERYESAAGWEPKKIEKKEMKNVVTQSDLFCGFEESMLATRPGPGGSGI